MTFLFAQAPAEVGVPKTRSVSLLLAGPVLALALLGLVGQAAPSAHADADNSGNFLGALSAKGITYTSGPAAIAAGREICSELDQGKQAGDVANDAMTRTNLDGYHAGFFVGASIAAMCPKHLQ